MTRQQARPAGPHADAARPQMYRVRLWCWAKLLLPRPGQEPHAQTKGSTYGKVGFSGRGNSAWGYSLSTPVWLVTIRLPLLARCCSRPVALVATSGGGERRRSGAALLVTGGILRGGGLAGWRGGLRGGRAAHWFRWWKGVWQALAAGGLHWSGLAPNHRGAWPAGNVASAPRRLGRRPGRHLVRWQGRRAWRAARHGGGVGWGGGGQH